MITSNRASLSLHSETHPASAVSAVLGLDPSSSFEKGDPMVRGRVRKSSGWTFHAPAADDPADDSNSYSRLESLARILRGKAPALALLRENYTTTIGYGGFSDSEQGGFYFPAETMAELGALGCTWLGSVYLEDPDDDDDDDAVDDVAVAAAAAVDDGILEHARLPVTPGREAEFEAAFAAAKQLIAASPGFRSLRLSRSIETPNEYLLLVGWDSLDAHETGFRGSERYAAWSSALHGFYEPFPEVVHFTPVARQSPL